MRPGVLWASTAAPRILHHYPCMYHSCTSQVLVNLLGQSSLQAKEATTSNSAVFVCLLPEPFLPLNGLGYQSFPTLEIEYSFAFFPSGVDYYREVPGLFSSATDCSTRRQISFKVQRSLTFFSNLALVALKFCFFICNTPWWHFPDILRVLFSQYFSLHLQ